MKKLTLNYGLRARREAGEKFWRLYNKEGELWLALPACLNETQLKDTVEFIIPYGLDQFKRGKLKGAAEEREKITYGLKAVLKPLIDAAKTKDDDWL